MTEQIESRPAGLRSLPKRQVTATLIGVMLAMFISSLDQTVVGTAMPRIIADLGGFTHYTWVTAAYLVTSTVAVPISGKLIDMYGRKSFYLIGLVIFTLGSLLSGLSQTMTEIIIFRGFQGVGAGVMMSTAFTVIGDLFPPAERGKYQGLISGVFGISSIIGPTLGGYITDLFSWHWIFFINIPLGIGIIVLFILFFPEIKLGGVRRHVDYAGVTTLILAVVPAMLALSWGGVEFPWASYPIVGMLVFSVVMGTVFVIIETRAKEPVLPMALFKNRIVAVSLLVIFFSGIGMFGAIIFVPLFFQGVLGVSAIQSGNFLTPMMLGMVGGSLLSGQAVSRAWADYRLQGAIGIAIMALGTFMLSRMTAQTGYAAALLNITLTGFGLGVTMPLYTIAIQNAVPYSMMGVATSSSAFFRSIGGSLGLAILGSAMNNRFAATFIASLPPAARAAIPPQQLSSLAKNPQALVSLGAQDQLKTLLAPLGSQGDGLLHQLLQLMRQALASALSEVFLIAFCSLVLAFIVNLFVKVIPLRKQHIVVEHPGAN